MPFLETKNKYQSVHFNDVVGMKQVGGGGGPRLSKISHIYDPPIYDITSSCRVAALFSREAQTWTLFGFLVIFTHRLTELCILNAKNVEKVYSRPFKSI